jgi:transposase-like protein
MKRFCPNCFSGDSRFRKHGRFVRKSDGRSFFRFKCMDCHLSFSDATFHSCYRQKKRRLNPRVFELLCSGVSQRRIARLLKLSRTTVERKFLFLANISMRKNFENLKKSNSVTQLQFDDLETIEHTKCKPLSVAMAVENPSRKILGFSVSQMPAKGHLAKLARKKYGRRKDQRTEGWNQLFNYIRPRLANNLRIESDENPHYPKIVRNWCPEAEHRTIKSRRGCVAGQGELKKIGFDPLFSLNHTFAMCRANINRLFRKTWCTTKRPDRLVAHLHLYVNYHNQILTAQQL